MPGDRIPVDGIVYEGETSLDQSAITGESIPCEKITGDEVISASINAGNYFVMKATKVGDDTTLSKITKLVEKASATKAPIAKIADKVAGIFIPVVILVAAITFALWMFLGRDFSFSMQRAVAVLVVFVSLCTWACDAACHNGGYRQRSRYGYSHKGCGVS